ASQEHGDVLATAQGAARAGTRRVARRQTTAMSKTSSAPTGQHTFDLYADAWGRLVLVDAAGIRHEAVEPVRAFPMTAPGQCVSIVDSHGHELLCVEELNTLPESIRQILVHELERREFVPIIRAIVSVSGESSPSEWRVDTDRGTTTFTLDSDEGIRR